MPLKHFMIFLVTFLKHNSSKISVLAAGLLAACESSERILWFIISVKIKQNKHTIHSTSSGKGPLSLSPQFLPSSGPHVQLHTGYKKTNLLWNSGRTLTGWRLFCSYLQQSYVCVLEASWVSVKEAAVTQKHVHIRKRTQNHPWKKHLHHDCCFWLLRFSRKNKYAVIRCQTKKLHILQVSVPTPPRVNGESLLFTVSEYIALPVRTAGNWIVFFSIEDILTEQ